MASRIDTLIPIALFYGWLFVLYWVHRLAHAVPLLRQFHIDHHMYILRTRSPQRWHWSNLFLFNDTYKSTIDLWITEVVPTVVFAAVFDTWEIAAFYYVWAAIFQEELEHNEKVNLPFFTFGRWHLVHHEHHRVNFGLFTDIWDTVFGTNRPLP